MFYSIQNNGKGFHRRQPFTQLNLSLKKSFLIQSTLKLLLDESHHALAMLAESPSQKQSTFRHLTSRYHIAPVTL